MIQERILQYLEYKGVSKYKFYQKTGLSNGFLDKNSSIGSEKCEIICSCYPDINLEWLITGKGKMLKLEANLNPSAGIPMVSVEALAGLGNTDFFISEKHVLAHYIIPEFREAEMLVPIKGDSMLPEYPPGAVAAYKKVDHATFVQWNRVYMVGTKSNGILLKRIMPGKTKTTWSLVSDNLKYLPVEIPISDVTGVAILIGIIRLDQ